MASQRLASSRRSLRPGAELLAHDAIPCEFGSPSQSECRVGGLSVRLTLVNRREGGRDFEFPRAALCCHPCSAFLLPLCTLSVSLRFAARDRGGGEGKRGERKSGQREEARGRKWAAAPTWATAAMEPCGLVCFTLTVGSRLVGHVTASPFFLFGFRGVQKRFCANCGLARAVPGPFPGSPSQTAFLSVSTCPPVELKMFLISCGGFPPSPFFLSISTSDN